MHMRLSLLPFRRDAHGRMQQRQRNVYVRMRYCSATMQVVAGAAVRASTRTCLLRCCCELDVTQDAGHEASKDCTFHVYEPNDDVCDPNDDVYVPIE